MEPFKPITAEEAAALFGKTGKDGKRNRVHADQVARAIEAGELRGRIVSNTHWTTVEALNEWIAPK